MNNCKSKELFPVLQMMESATGNSGRKVQKTRSKVGLELAAPVVFSISWLAYFLVVTSAESYSLILM